MGLDAYVKCNCYKQGKTAPLPFDPALLVWAAEGYPDIKRLPHMDDALYEKLGQSLYVWEREACEHHNMYHCWLRVGNWPAVRSFQQALHSLGPESFPVLRRHIPDGNGGLLPVAEASAALAELALFRERIGTATNLFLMDAITDEVIFDYIAAYGGEFAWSKAKGSVTGFDDEGLFIYHRDTKALLFRSLHFQQKISPVLWRRRHKVTLTDKVTGRSIRIPFPLGGTDGNREFKIERRGLTPADFHALTSLETLLHAAIATGNPVIWC